ncbi:MurR/RpiR family transcriptional regulator [Mesomycoplasma lagogenitalium]|uniref:MurR/RpiR family transcriptional regulator n=1 Tax=Mesomycoplasma lagogenitalium TaxID=171286 RepID=A0ABY8LX36_9BACT|nr:MurR/RpiR family transcriptional regulator [Mesomycoplasma lagogenitalium]WGI36976.1 MurR/RpiR family transcriptional regulator [Mesomycoplasma lagogenitalium]
MDNNILKRINSLTNVEKRILDFINLFHEKEFDFSQKELSQIIYCSEASISRFAKKYGFNSYKLLTIYINKRIKEIEFLENSIDHLKNEKGFLNIYETQKYAVNSALSKENIFKIKLATSYIKKANKVFLFALGTSAKIMSEFAVNLKKISIHSIFDMDFHSIFPLLGTIEKDDVVICLSNNFNNNEIHFAIHKAKELGAKTIVITSNYENIFANLIDIKIIYSKISNLENLVPLSSKISHLVILDYLFNYILNSDKKYQYYLQKTNNILLEWRKLVILKENK